jgi:glycosyltransferase involved in cell wall biosynthesis
VTHPSGIAPAAAAADTLPAAAASVPSGKAVRPDRIWIAWERQRRSLGLARRLGALLCLCLDEDRGWLRYPLSAYRTVRLLLRSRGKAVFVQNPSMVLAALAGLLKRPLGYHLVVDRHSNFSFLSGGPAGTKRVLSDLLSGFTLRAADRTIVTNLEMARIIEAKGARAFVLPDPFPDVPEAARRIAAERPPKDPGAPAEILFVSSWAFDEPIAETVEACRALKGRVIVHVTGRVKPSYQDLLAGAPDNFRPTGFLSDEDYFALMARCDAVMAVTKRSCTLVCGAYEAIALGKPMVLGDSAALREYFDEGAVYTDSTFPDLVLRLDELLKDLPARREAVARLLARRGPEWERKLADLEASVDAAVAALRRP